MKILFRLGAALILAVSFIGAPQVEAAKQKPTQKELKAACEEAKKAGDYDTPMGRGRAKARCQPGGFTSKTYWREINRQYACLERTRQLCPD